jgi:hypothetical protein
MFPEDIKKWLKDCRDDDAMAQGKGIDPAEILAHWRRDRLRLIMLLSMLDKNRGMRGASPAGT